MPITQTPRCVTVYDPYTHADQLAIPIIYTDPGGNLDGLWNGLAILIRPGLPARVERCIIAHEIVHAEYGDEPTSDPTWTTRREARCNRIAAERLINPDELVNAMRTTPDPGQVALDLNVTSWILQAYLANHPDLNINP